MYDQFTQRADEYWQEEISPSWRWNSMLNRAASPREVQGTRPFASTSLQVVSRYFMAEALLHAKLKNRIKAEMPEILKYYNDQRTNGNLTGRPRSVARDPGRRKRYPSRAEARRKVDALTRRLGGGPDFARLATAHSDGPSRSREQGGLMETSPGSYG